MPAASGLDAVIDAAEAGRLFEPLAELPKLALAVSGGADSTALMLLLSRWRAARRRGPELSVFTVDHGLRPESRAEAEQVSEWASALGLRHEILTWRGEKPRSNIQAEARAARYKLLAEACHRDGIAVLATAHHIDDQAETFLMRLARGSGVDGLSAMDAVNEILGITVVRPLLDVSGFRLMTTLDMAGHPWIEDPSNEDVRFARIRMRIMLEKLEKEGVTAERLAATAGHMRRAKQVLDLAADALAGQAARLDPAGFCEIDRDGLLSAPPETTLRLLARALMAVGGNPYRPRLERLERLCWSLADTEKGRWTLAGCCISLSRGRVRIWREAGRAGLPELTLKPGRSAMWDGRYHVEIGPETPGPVIVRALGEDGWREIRPLKPEKPGGSAQIAHGCISFWRRGALLAVPHITAVPQPAEPIRATFLGTLVSRPGAPAPW